MKVGNEILHTGSVWIGNKGCIFDDAYQRNRKICCEDEN